MNPSDTRNFCLALRNEGYGVTEVGRSIHAEY